MINLYLTHIDNSLILNIEYESIHEYINLTFSILVNKSSKLYKGKILY